MGAWLKAGCFITGYNYSILKNCSEVAKKTVKKYTAAMVIMCLLWGLIGYSFANRYLHSSPSTSLASALLFILVIIQIERQIIMQTMKNNYLQLFRAVIAIMMACIGSIIIDQIIFKDDIELEKELFINNKVERIYPDRADIRQKQINQLRVQLLAKDSQRTTLAKDIQTHPTITITNVKSNPVPIKTTTDDLSGSQSIQYSDKPIITKTQIQNPNNALIGPLDSQINSIQRLILAQGDSLANLRASIQKLLQEKTGFLDELNIMFSLLSKSTPALVVYLVWFILLLGLECFILMNKRHEKPTDYDAMILHQMNTHLKKLEILSATSKSLSKQ